MPARPFIYKPPTEAVDGALGTDLRKVARAFAVATLVALLLGSKPLLNWANELPIGPVSDLLLYAAQGWEDASEAAGLTRYSDSIRYWLRRFEGER